MAFVSLAPSRSGTGGALDLLRDCGGVKGFVQRLPSLARLAAGPDTPWPLLWCVTAVALIALYLAPYVLPGMIPLLDLPNHLGVTRVLMDLGRGTTLDTYFVPNPNFTPYVLGYSLLTLCCKAFGTLGGARAFLAAMVVSYALSVLFLARVLRSNPWAALASLPFAYHYGFIQGFINWIPAVPLLLASVGLVLRQMENPTASRTVLLLAVGTALLLAPPLASVGFMAAVAGSWLLRPRRGEAIWLQMLPALATAFPFYLLNRATPWMQFNKVRHMTAVEWIERAWDVSTPLLNGRVDDWALVGTWLSILALVALAIVAAVRRQRAPGSGRAWWTRSHLLLPAATWLVISLAPMYVDGNAVAPRMMVFAYTFSLLGLSRELTGRRVAALAPGLLSSFVAGWVFLSSVLWFQRGPARDVERVLAHLPEGQVVLPLISGKDPGNPFHRGPYDHIGQYALALRAAVVPRSFARLPVAPVRYSGPGSRLRGEWRIGNLDVARVAPQYGWLLVREPFTAEAELVFRTRHRLRRVSSAGTFWLYEIPGGARPHPPRGNPPGSATPK